MPGAGLHGFLQNFSTGEVVVVAIVALVVLGPERLPDMARSLGRMLHKLRTMTESLRDEMGDVIDHPSMEPIKELGEFAARPREKLAAYALEAEAEERRRRAEAESAGVAAERAEQVHEADAGAGPAPQDGPGTVATSSGESAGATGQPGADVPEDASVPSGGPVRSEPPVRSDEPVPGTGVTADPDRP